MGGSSRSSKPLREERKAVVALALTKHDRAVEDRPVLSEPFQKLMVSWSCDIEEMWARVKPPWGSGAKFFLEEFGHGDAEEFRTWFGKRPGLGPQWIFVYQEDERAILEPLRLESDHRALATVKPQGRVGVPDDDSMSWF